MGTQGVVPCSASEAFFGLGAPVRVAAQFQEALVIGDGFGGAPALLIHQAAPIVWVIQSGVEYDGWS
jgi:hypothetical protein